MWLSLKSCLKISRPLPARDWRGAASADVRACPMLCVQLAKWILLDLALIFCRKSRVHYNNDTTSWLGCPRVYIVLLPVSGFQWESWVVQWFIECLPSKSFCFMVLPKIHGNVQLHITTQRFWETECLMQFSAWTACARGEAWSLGTRNYCTQSNYSKTVFYFWLGMRSMAGYFWLECERFLRCPVAVSGIV